MRIIAGPAWTRRGICWGIPVGSLPVAMATLGLGCVGVKGAGGPADAFESAAGDLPAAWQDKASPSSSGLRHVRDLVE